MSAPKITVYIPSHNYGRFLAGAIESVVRQRRDDWELLVIDDNSSDDTREVMARYREDPRVRLLQGGGVGLPAVCNLALREARGEYVIRLDADDLFDENILLVLGEWLDRDPELALVFPDYYLVDEGGEVFAHERHVRPVNGHAADMPLNGACTLVRKDILTEAGGYREDLGAQDGFDLWSRIAGKHKVAGVSLPLFYYRRHSENLTNNRRRILSARRQIKKDASAATLIEFKPVIAVIPCRTGHDFCPDAWSRELGRRTLLARAIETCLASTVFDHVVVASDTPQVRDVMGGYDDARLVFHARDRSGTARTTSLAPTLDAIARGLDTHSSGVTVLAYVQAPFVTTQTLEESVFTLAMNRSDTAVGVEEIVDPVYKRTEEGLQAVNAPRAPLSEHDHLYREANLALAIRNPTLVSGTLSGRNVANFVVAPDECFFIDSEMKLRIAGILLDER